MSHQLVWQKKPSNITLNWLWQCDLWPWLSTTWLLHKFTSYGMWTRVVCSIYRQFKGTICLHLPHTRTLLNSEDEASTKLITKSKEKAHNFSRFLRNVCKFQLRYTVLRYIALRYTALCYIALRYTELRYTSLRYTALRYIALRYIALRYTALRPHRQYHSHCCIKLSDQYNIINVLSVIYFSYTWHVSADNCGHRQASLQKYKR